MVTWPRLVKTAVLAGGNKRFLPASMAENKRSFDRQTDERTDPIVRDYRDAIRLLQETAQEKFHLGIDDPTTSPGSAGEFLIHPGNKVFGREGRP